MPVAKGGAPGWGRYRYVCFNIPEVVMDIGFHDINVLKFNKEIK